MTWLKIENGIVVDPANNVDQVIGDIWIREGKIATTPTGTKPDKVIDASGKIVMAGGVDVHCHIAGPKVNSARKMFPALMRDVDLLENSAPLMTTEQSGLKYAGLGYTTAFDAAVPAMMTRHAQMEFEDTPCIDKGMFVLTGNNHFIFEAIRNGKPEQIKGFLGWLLKTTGSYAPKLVNPGGVEKWKQAGGNQVGGIDSIIDNGDLTPRKIIEAIVRAGNELDLPHAAHIHCNDLGRPGNWKTTLETMKSLDGLRAHLTHIQFHSYDGGEDDEGSFGSKVQTLADYVNSHSNLTVDVGQVLFGKTISLTGDGALGEYLYRVNNQSWFNYDLELEAGCGISPLVYKHRNAISAIQWMVGLEWFLSVNDPWQVCLSTDHPNGGSFLAYPQVIAFLMSEAVRREAIAKLNPKLVKSSRLAEMTREYSLYEIAIITRAGPARILGLSNKGHLGENADADITIYSPDDDKQKMFSMPEYVIKSGELLIENSTLRQANVDRVETRLLTHDAKYDPAIRKPIGKWLESFGTMDLETFENTSRPDEVAAVN